MKNSYLIVFYILTIVTTISIIAYLFIEKFTDEKINTNISNILYNFETKKLEKLITNNSKSRKDKQRSSSKANKNQNNFISSINKSNRPYSATGC